MKNHLQEEGLKYKALKNLFFTNKIDSFYPKSLKKVKILPKEIKGPRVGVPENILENFIKCSKG